MIDKKIVEDFKYMKISRKDMSNLFGVNLMSLSLEEPVVVDSIDVIEVLRAFREKKISVEELIDWVNIVWFSDLFDYNDEQADSISSVMNRLEELDENKNALSNQDVDTYIEFLKNNKEVPEYKY